MRVQGLLAIRALRRVISQEKECNGLLDHLCEGFEGGMRALVARVSRCGGNEGHCKTALRDLAFTCLYRVDKRPRRFEESLRVSHLLATKQQARFSRSESRKFVDMLGDFDDDIRAYALLPGQGRVR